MQVHKEISLECGDDSSLAALIWGLGTYQDEGTHLLTQ